MGLRSWLARVRRHFRAERPRTAQTTSTRPRVEELEDRLVPAAPVTDTYLAAVYQGFLGRALDLDGLTFWGARLREGATREQVAAAILDSPEARGRQLQILYATYLGRPLDTAGLQFWGDVFQDQNATYERVKAGILGSPEFFVRTANDNLVFLDTIYRGQLNRPLDAVGQVFWTQRLAAGVSREDVVAQILASEEANRIKVIGVYQEALARPLDQAGDDFWVDDVLGSGRPLEDMIAGVTGSDEFLNALTASLFRSNINDANVAADAFFREGFRFDSALPALETLNRFFITDQGINTLVDFIPDETLVTNLINFGPAGQLATGLPGLVTTTTVPTLTTPTVSPTGVNVGGVPTGFNTGLTTFNSGFTTFTTGMNSGFLNPFGGTTSAFPSLFI
jgi:hypothetical protein